MRRTQARLRLLARRVKPVWRRLKVAVPRVTRAQCIRWSVATLITLVLSYAVELQDAPGEAALARRALTSAPVADDRVAVVRIDEHDFGSLFGKTNPLNAAMLDSVIRAVASARPRVIGIDVDSDSSVYAGVPDSIDGVPLVWEQTWSCRRIGSKDADCPADDRLPGKAAGRTAPGGLRAGVSVLPLDDDGFTRRYQRMLKTADADLPSFTTVVLDRAGFPVEREPAHHDRLILYRPVVAAEQRFTAGAVLNRFRNGGFGPDNALSGKIVLLGGTYETAPDKNLTPLGDMAGVDVLAQVIRTEVEGGGPEPPGKGAFFIVQFIAGIAIVFIFRIPGVGRPLLVAMMFSVATAVVASWTLFGTPALWLAFLPAVGVWMIQELYGQVKTVRDGASPERARPAPVPALAIGPASSAVAGEEVMAGGVPSGPPPVPPVHIFRGDG